MGALLRDRRGLHQPGVNVPINLAVRVNNLLGIILSDDWDGFPFSSSTLEAETRIGLCCLAYGLLAHWAHRIHGERWPRTFVSCSLLFLGDRWRRIPVDLFCRLFVNGRF